MYSIAYSSASAKIFSTAGNLDFDHHSVFSLSFLIETFAQGCALPQQTLDSAAHLLNIVERMQRNRGNE